jgi:hypothetical protein
MTEWTRISLQCPDVCNAKSKCEALQLQQAREPEFMRDATRAVHMCDDLVKIAS